MSGNHSGTVYLYLQQTSQQENILRWPYGSTAGRASAVLASSRVGRTARTRGAPTRCSCVGRTARTPPRRSGSLSATVGRAIRCVNRVACAGMFSTVDRSCSVKNLMKNHVEVVDKEINKLPKKSEIDVGIDSVNVVHKRKRTRPKKFADYILYKSEIDCDKIQVRFKFLL